MNRLAEWHGKLLILKPPFQDGFEALEAEEGPCWVVCLEEARSPWSSVDVGRTLLPFLLLLLPTFQHMLAGE